MVQYMSAKVIGLVAFFAVCVSTIVGCAKNSDSGNDNPPDNGGSGYYNPNYTTCSLTKNGKIDTSCCYGYPIDETCPDYFLKLPYGRAASQTSFPIAYDYSSTDTFKKGFLWGLASSAYQVVGAYNHGGRGASVEEKFLRPKGAKIFG